MGKGACRAFLSWNVATLHVLGNPMKISAAQKSLFISVNLPVNSPTEASIVLALLTPFIGPSKTM